MLVKPPDRDFRLGETLPSLGQRVVSWPWGGTPHITQWAIDALKYPLGTIILDIIDGHPVVAQIQTHDTYGAHPEWGVKLHKGTSVFVPVDESGRPMRDPPDGWAVSTMNGWHDRFRGGEMERWREWRWREHFTRVPKLAVLAGATLAGAFFSPLGAVVGLAAGLVLDREVRGGDWLDGIPGFHGDGGTWKVFRYDPTTCQFLYAGMVNASTEGSAIEEATTQVFNASASKSYPLPGFTNVYITSQGDVFRVGMDS